MRTLALICLLASGCVRAYDIPGDRETGRVTAADVGAVEAAVMDAPGDVRVAVDLPDLGALGDLGGDCTCAAADLDGDGSVGDTDIDVITKCWALPPTGGCAASDINKDGLIDAADYGCLATLYGQSCTG